MFAISLLIASNFYNIINKKIIHRDLKPSNLVFSEKNNLNSLTIIDFGFATPTNLNRFLLYKCGMYFIK